MEYDFRVGEKIHVVAVEKKGERWLVAVDGRAFEADVAASEPDTYSLVVDGEATRAVVVRAGPRRFVALDGHVITLEEPAAEGFTPAGADEDVVGGVQTIKAPMPGKVVKVAAAVGARVEKGQTVVVVEAMKMEHALAAAGPGTVLKITCVEGQNVDASQPLAEVEVGAA